MKKRTLGALALALCFALSLFAVPAAADAPAAAGAEEVIYAKLDAAGEPLSAYAVVALNGDAGESVTHYGAYTAVENLTDTSALTYEDGAVTATIPEGGRLYYQGTLESFELPWDIAIGYELDGKSISPAELGGQSGALEMTLSVKPNGNAPGAFVDEMMLQITVTLDASLCKDISAGGATVANAGGDKTLAFTVLPGAEAEYTVTADVEDFTMAGLTIAGVNYDIASAMGDTAEITDGVGQMTDAISQLSDGASQLASGAGSLRSGAGSFGSGLSTLSAGSAELVAGSEQIAGALSQISASLPGAGTDAEAAAAAAAAAGMDPEAAAAAAAGAQSAGAGMTLDLSALAQLPAGLEQAADGLEQAGAALAQLAEGYGAAYPALEQAVEAIPEPSVSEEDIGALMALAPDNAALAALVANYQAAQTVKAVWAQASAAFEAVQDNLPALAEGVNSAAASLRQTAQQISAAMSATGGQIDLSGLLQLTSGLSQLAQSYSAFHEGLVSYAGGVDALSANWSSVYSGISSLAGGAGELSDGVAALNEETSKIPELIDELTGGSAEDESADASAQASFLDERNEDTASVQFVIMTEGISEPEAEEEPAPAEEDKGFFAELWDRIVALFT